MSAKKVLFILPSFLEGGTENYALQFIKSYSNKYDWSVVSLSSSRGGLMDQFEQFSKVYYLSIGYLNPLKLIGFYKFLKKHKFETIVTFNGAFGGLAIWYALLAGVQNRLVFFRRSDRAFTVSFLRNVYYRMSGKLVKKYATFILSNSKLALDNFMGESWRNKTRYAYLPNGVNLEKFNNSISKNEAKQQLGIVADEIILGHVGRYTPVKNHENLLRAAQNLKLNGLSFKLILCGRNTDSRELQLKINDLGLSENVVILGIRNDVNVVLRAMDYFVFPSFSEGQPNALLEAMASGLPAIASNIPPITDCLPNAWKDYCFDPESADEISDSIMNCIQSKNTDAAIVQSMNFIKDNFNQDKCFADFKALL